MRVARYALISLIAIMLAASCASVPAKQRAVLANQSAGQVVWTLQDTERRLCNQASFDKDPNVPITECAGPMADAAKLTTDKHREFAKTLSQVYALRLKVDTALLLWQPGQPPPSELQSLQGQAEALLAIARSLATTDKQRELIEAGQTLIAEIEKIAKAIKG